MALTVPPRENPDPSNLCAVTAPRSPCLASLSPGRASELWKAPAHALALGSCHEVVIWEEPAFMPVCPLFLQPKFMAQHAPPSHAGKVVLYCTAHGTLLNVMWQPGWEGSLRENGYMYD